MNDDLELLQGAWSISRLEVDGQTMPESMLASAKIAIKGNRFASTGMGVLYKGTLKLDTSTNPRQLDMKFDAGPEKGNLNLGIYRLDGDTWHLCLATRGTVRPTTFASVPGTGFALETLIRGSRKIAAKRNPRQARQARSTHATEFDGEWQMVTGVMNGEAMEASVVQWVKRITLGNETTVYAGPQVMMKFEFTSDSSKSPQTIDYTNTAGPNKGKTQQGIFEFEQDLLKICTAAPGSTRPSKFESRRGDGRTFTVWVRK
jgi:uncharacterized protein (TIGR03067 family)